MGLVTVAQAAALLHLHPKTVLRYIRDGRLPATRVGKSYRIARDKLDSFAGLASRPLHGSASLRATCVVEVPSLTTPSAERLATRLQAAALSRPAHSPPMNLQTAYDPIAQVMKVVLIAGPSDAAAMLEIMQGQVTGEA